jgi:hypothetical protein
MRPESQNIGAIEASCWLLLLGNGLVNTSPCHVLMTRKSESYERSIWVTGASRLHTNKDCVGEVAAIYQTGIQIVTNTEF